MAPLPCAITDPDAGHYESAASSLGSTPDKVPKGADSDADADGDPFPIEVSSSDEAAVIARCATKVKRPQPSIASACRDRGEEVDDKGKKDIVGAYGVKDRQTRVSKPSSFVDCDDDGDEEDEKATGACAVKEVSRKVLKASSFGDYGNDDKMKGKGAYGLDKVTRRVPKASKFGNYDAADTDDDDAGKEKENRGFVEDDDDDVDWEKTEDFKMEPTGSGVMLKPYKLPGRIFKMLYPHQREGLRWLWVLHCRGTGGILGDDMGLGKTMQVQPFILLLISFIFKFFYRIVV